MKLKEAEAIIEGILFAAGMMALGANGEEAPGFPSDGWVVKSEEFMNW